MLYSRIAEILDKYFGEQWFLDSGSLLGVVRDGKFLSSDVGIDISVIIDNHRNPKIEECVKELRKEGLVISRYQINGVTYKYCLVPKCGNRIPYAFDLHLFKKDGENYMCPNMTGAPSSNNIFVNFFKMIRLGGIISKKGIVGFCEKIVVFFYRDIFEYFGKPVNYKLEDESVYKWLMPIDMIRGVEREKTYDLNVLKECGDYLSYRYGNWRVPVSDWVTIRDDGGFVKATAAEILRFIEK